MLKYSPTLSSAKACADAGELDVWIHRYLHAEGRNVPLSDGLKLFRRYYIGPALFPLRLFTRCAGPEPGMEYRIDPDWWAHRVAELEEAIRTDPDMPPFLVHYTEGGFELSDGNHRHKACENLGVDKVPAIVWITEEAELEDFLAKYGESVRGCSILRR